MRTVSLIIISFFLTTKSFCQCLTDFSKLVPEPAIDYSVEFGHSISMHEDFLAVGIPNSDSVGRITGLVNIYKKDGTKWVKNSGIVPAIPLDGLQFGWSVKITQDYLFVGAYAQGGSVYVYRKNGVDWNNFTELAIWKIPGAQIFGTWDNNPIGVTIDQNTVAITDVWHRDSSFPNESTGAIYLYHKNIIEEWSNSSTPLLIPPPEEDVDDFGGGGILFQGNRMATFTRFAPTGNGRIYVYKDEIEEFDNPILEAKLGAGDGTYSYGFNTGNFAFTNDGIFLMASVDISTPNPKYHVAFFQQPQGGKWNDGYLTCHFSPDLDPDITFRDPTLFTSSGNDLIISSRNANNKGTLTLLKKGTDGWCNPIRQSIDESLPDPSTQQRYGLTLASNTNADITIGFVSNVNTGITQVALKTFANTGNAWDSNYLYTLRKSTAGHYFGRKVIGIGDNLFVSSPYDGTVKANAGAVYIYTKSGANWLKKGKIVPPPGGQYDDVFASNMAATKDFLVVAAVGHSPNGKFFVYNNDNDWDNPQLVQEINLANNGFSVNVSGDNIAMSDKWLVLPYMDSPSSPSKIYLALYKFNGTNFQFEQSLYVRDTDFFARSSTVPVSIEENLIVAGSTIIELNESGIWEIKYQLFPSDPEPIQFSSDFTRLITNGDRFGTSNWISNGTIFISAPTKDYNGIWDVGAVYVYAKLPEEPWSSRTESAKIVPHVKEPNGLFGYSLAALQNTLIVGSPINDFDKNRQAINKPGKASIFQSRDYFWQETNWIADFSGDSFVKDYFGLAVHLDETDFFMGAPIEDLETGKISGSVYMVPTPPIVKLVPPVCMSENVVQLLGYPFQGTWSGSGITNSNNGTFSPALAGVGEHTLTYQTPNCANTGTVKIEVLDAPLPVIINQTEHLVCQNANPIAITLESTSEPNINYLWYYRASSSAKFQSQQVTTPSIVATKRGEYQLKASNSLCSSFSPVITIKNEIIELELAEPHPSCNTSTTNVELQALPTGGTWTGNGVMNNYFIPLNKPTGLYALTYTYTSEINCSYSKAITATVVTPFIPTLEKSGDICLDGTATINLTTSPITPTSIKWYQKSLTDIDYTIVENEGNSIEVNKNGKIKVITENAYCSPEEAIITIDDSFTVTMTPDEPTLKLCEDNMTNLIVTPISAKETIQWIYYENTIDEITIINSTDFQIRPDKSGYYFAALQLGNCQINSSPKYVTILPADTVFIPNVFTPNGDGKNDTFKIITNDPSAYYEIYNRYGNHVYTGSSNTEWDGGNLSSGVYYWIAPIKNCMGNKVMFKGYVHLIR